MCTGTYGSGTPLPEADLVGTGADRDEQILAAAHRLLTLVDPAGARAGPPASASGGQRPGSARPGRRRYPPDQLPAAVFPIRMYRCTSPIVTARSAGSS